MASQQDAKVNATTSSKLDKTIGDDPTHENDKEILHPSLTLRTKEVPNPEALNLDEELPGWHGYIEWEKYPDRKKAIKEYMKKFEFPGVSLYSLPTIFH